MYFKHDIVKIWLFFICIMSSPFYITAVSFSFDLEEHAWDWLFLHAWHYFGFRTAMVFHDGVHWKYTFIFSMQVMLFLKKFITCCQPCLWCISHYCIYSWCNQRPPVMFVVKSHGWKKYAAFALSQICDSLPLAYLEGRKNHAIRYLAEAYNGRYLEQPDTKTDIM